MTVRMTIRSGLYWPSFRMTIALEVGAARDTYGAGASSSVSLTLLAGRSIG